MKYILGVSCVLNASYVLGAVHVLNGSCFVNGIWVVCIVRILGLDWFLDEGNNLHVAYVLYGGCVLKTVGVFYILVGDCILYSTLYSSVYSS